MIARAIEGELINHFAEFPVVTVFVRKADSSLAQVGLIQEKENEIAIA